MPIGNFSVGGYLWRAALNGITGGLINPLAMGEHAAEVQAQGGNIGGLIAQGLGNAGMAYQQGFMGGNGQQTFSQGLQNGVVQNKVNEYIPWIIAGFAALLTVIVVIFKTRR